MDIGKSLLGFALLVVATGVGMHFVFDPLYADLVDTGRIWDIIDLFMVVAALTAVVVNCFNRRDDNLGDSTLFYASLLLIIWLLWNWIDNITIGEGVKVIDAESQSDIHMIFWSIIDPMFAIVVSATGCRLLTGSRR